MVLLLHCRCCHNAPLAACTIHITHLLTIAAAAAAGYLLYTADCKAGYGDIQPTGYCNLCPDGFVSLGGHRATCIECDNVAWSTDDRTMCSEWQLQLHALWSGSRFVLYWSAFHVSWAVQVNRTMCNEWHG
jgi:hypothetical protein